MRKIIFSFLLLCPLEELFPQCCTSGCCMPGTANFGVLEKGDLLFFSFFKKNYSDRYYSGDRPVNFNYLINDYSDYTGTSFSYGLTSKLTIQASLGYFIDKTENFNIPMIGEQQLFGQGMADLELYFKYNVYTTKNERLSLVVSGGSKMPTGPFRLETNSVLLTRDVQPGAGAYSGIFALYALVKPFKNKTRAIMFNSRTDFNGVNPLGYQYGVTNTNTISTTIKLYKEISLIAMARNENHDIDKVNGVGLFSSCSSRIFVTPGIALNLGHDLNFSCYGDFPLYQYYGGIQLAAKYAFSFAISKIFEFHKKPLPEVKNETI